MTNPPNAGAPTVPAGATPEISDEELLRAFEALPRMAAKWPNGRAVKRREVNVECGPFFHHQREILQQGDEVWLVVADGSFKPDNTKGKVAGIAWQVSTPTRQYKVKTSTKQKYKGGPQMAEVHAAISGMREALAHGARHIVLRTDSQTVAHYLAETWSPSEDGYTSSAHNDLILTAAQFGSVQVDWVRGKTIRAVDRAAKRAMVKKQNSVEERWAEVVKNIESMMAKAPKVTSIKTFPEHNLTVHHVGQFTVCLEGPSCSCPFWKMRTEKALFHNPRNLKRICSHVAAVIKDRGMTAEQGATYIVERATIQKAARLKKMG